MLAPIYAKEDIMPVFSEIFSQVEKQSSLEGQQKTWTDWVESHPDVLIPHLSEGMITFIYADMNKAEKAVQDVELTTFQGSKSDQVVKLKRWKKTILYSITIKAPQNLETFGYEYHIYRDGKKKKAAELNNHAVNFKAGKRNAIIDPQSTHGVVLMLDAPRPLSKLKKRKIWVYLPAGYFQDSTRDYPVFYMQDGQNLWDYKNMPYGGWKMDSTADQLIQSGKVEPFIIIGVENSSDRAFEYVGFSMLYNMDKEGFISKYPQFKTQIESAPRLSADFVDYFVKQIMPWAETHFRIKKGKESTTIGGSSFGAGVSLQIAFRYPDLFSKVASLSGGNYPAEEIGPQYLKPFNVFPYLIEKLMPTKPSFKIYLHCGDQDLDANFIKLTRKMHEALLKKGWKENLDLYYVIDQGKGHNEKTWAARMPEVVEYFYGK